MKENIIFSLRIMFVMRATSHSFCLSSRLYSPNDCDVMDCNFLCCAIIERCRHVIVLEACTKLEAKMCELAEKHY